MAADIRITPAIGEIKFDSSLAYTQTISQNESGTLIIKGSGTAGRTEIFGIDGSFGRLFTVSDDLTDSLWSVNTIAGLPVMEVYSDNTVKIGRFNNEAIIADPSSNVYFGNNIYAAGTISGINVTSGIDPGHTHSAYNNYSGWNLQVNTGTAAEVTEGLNVDFKQGTGITLALSGTDVTISTDSTYTRATSVLPTATVFSDVVISNGLITNIETKILTLSDLGFTGSSSADNYSSWTAKDGDTGTYAISSGNILTFAEGTGIDVNFTAENILTFSNTDLGSTQNIFKNIAVTGQSNIIADSNNDTLNFEGTGITLTTNATTNTLTVTNSDSGSGQSIFKNFAVTGQETITADINNDIITLVPGGNTAITTDAATDTITISSITSGSNTDLTTSGALVVSSLVLTDGLVQSHATRTLTLADIGYTGPADPDNYAFWTARDGDTSTYAITSGDILQFAEGTGMDVDFTADDILTFTNIDRGSSQSIFKNFAVLGQSTISANINADTLTLVQGGTTTITTDAGLDTLTITSNDQYEGTLTSVTAGNGLDFTTISNAGSVILGTPGTITSITTNAVTATSHTHALGSIDAGDITSGILSVALGGTGLSSGYNNTNWDAAYTHSTDNSQAHSDYLINNGSDTTSGTITAAGFTTIGTVSAGTVSGINVTSGIDPGHTHSIYDNYNSWTALDNDSSSYTISSGNNLTFAESTGISVNFTAENVLTFTNTDLGASQNIFKNFAVSGQSTVIADSNNDTLTLAGAGTTTIVTDAGTDVITITSNDQFDGTVTSVAAGNGLNFTTISDTGSIILGTPETITSTTINAVTATSHTHALGSIDALDITSGILPVTRGGTGLATVNTNSILTGNGTGALTGETNLTFDGTTLSVNGDISATNVSISGDLTVYGTTYSIGTETIDVSTSYIFMNTGLTGAPATTLQSGIIIGRGSEDPYAILYDETNQQFRLGIAHWNGTQYEDASTQAAATREDNPISNGLTYWNDSDSILATSSNLTFNGTTLAANTITGINVTSGTDPGHTHTDAGSSQNIFKNFAVSGQSTIIADSNNDTLTLAAGDNITITTNATTDAITIASSDQFSGTVTSVGTNAPLTGTVTGSGSLSINQSTTSVDGYLSSTDWNTFNNKLADGDISAWAKAATKPSYTYDEVGADPIGTINYILPFTDNSTEWDTAYNDHIISTSFTDNSYGSLYLYLNQQDGGSLSVNISHSHDSEYYAKNTGILTTSQISIFPEDLEFDSTQASPGFYMANTSKSGVDISNTQWRLNIGTDHLFKWTVYDKLNGSTTATYTDVIKFSKAGDVDITGEFKINGVPISSSGGSGTVTSIASGNGMNFTTITETGTITLGTPGTTTSATTNAVTTTSHTHALGSIAAGDITSGTLPVLRGGTGLTSGYNNTNWDTAYTHDGQLVRRSTAMDWVDVFLSGDGTLGLPTATSSRYISYEDNGATYKLRAGYADDAGTLGTVAASNYARTDIEEVFGLSIGVGGAIPGSTFDNNNAIAIGDSDSGIRQNGDGVIELWANNVEVIQLNSSLVNIYKPLTVSGVITATGGNSTNWNTAYTHSTDNSQAHSDYLINNGSDTTSGTITAAGFTTAGTVKARTITARDTASADKVNMIYNETSETLDFIFV